MSSLVRFRSRRGTLVRAFVCTVLLVLGSGAGAPLAVASSPLPTSALGVNFAGLPAGLSTAAQAGVGSARRQIIQGTDIDSLVELTAAAHLRLYPMLGLPASHGASADAAAMAAFVTDFAKRYGPAGSFWGEHPELPYLPVTSYEIGDEPDVDPTQPQDNTSLHYADPAGYAQVYEAARSALHAVAPGLQAVVGGLLDSGPTLADVERYLKALTGVDAVGFHPYLYEQTAMEQDTVALRRWMNAHGLAAVPLDLNEFGSSSDFNTIGTWAQVVAGFTQWALCTPSLNVENVQVFWWGGTPSADADPWYPLLSSGGSLTPVGQAFIAEAHLLTTQGCPPDTPAAATAAAAPASPPAGTPSPSSRPGKAVAASALPARRPKPHAAVAGSKGRRGRHSTARRGRHSTARQGRHRAGNRSRRRAGNRGRHPTGRRGRHPAGRRGRRRVGHRGLLPSRGSTAAARPGPRQP